MKYEIDLTNVTSRSELYDLLERTLPLPSYTGRNLDALYDVLSVWTEETILHIRDRDCRDPELQRYLGRMKRMFGGLTEENPRIQVIFDSEEHTKECETSEQ